MTTREPVVIEELLDPKKFEMFKQAINDDNVESFRTFFEKNVSPIRGPLLPEDIFEQIPLTFYILGAGVVMGNEGVSDNGTYRPNIFAYLLDHGVDVNYISPHFLIASISSEYFSYGNVWTSLPMNAAVLGNLPALKLLYKHGADFSIVAKYEDSGRHIHHKENALNFAERRLLDIDEYIEAHISLISKSEKALARKPNNVRTKTRLADHKHQLQKEIQDRINIARVISWLRNITTEKNIPSALTRPQYNAYQNVLRKRLQLGNLELEKMSSFIPKPTKFTMPPRHGLNRINTKLFQGGRKTLRKHNRRRATRSRK